MDLTNGRTIRAATVCDTNVATVNIMNPNTSMTLNKLIPRTRASICSAIAARSPDDDTALPRAIPPMARAIIVHKKLLKSADDNKPGPNNSTTGTKANTPISPTYGSN
ncbi:hypothetical protein AWJ20_2968 [Sugiyamaella lignohabitans]|uniref:Uncharacterized protein n=1 Tax=Sugiyamaella lignohabitans TaxID=796027 RepID=A0A167FIG2_9ASCO|nr:uncharacterized protein AWJ20_2968 [Sugiyamaella lignohabitans]ANB15341.1 hypothetical protein AWJ20_2968 [Sugiyamaella lignohabitans]